MMRSISARRRLNALSTGCGIPATLGGAVVHGTPLDAEAPHEFAPKRRLVEIAAGLGVRVELAPVERRPAPIRAARDVRDEHVGVELRIAGPARAVAKR